MATFAAIADILPYFPQFKTIDSTTKPTEAQVTAWLEQTDSEIRIRLAGDVDFDNLTTEGINMLKTINAMMVACRIDDALPYLNPSTEDEEKRVRNLCKTANDLIEKIKKEGLQLSTAPVCALEPIISVPLPVSEFPKDRRF